MLYRHYTGIVLGILVVLGSSQAGHSADEPKVIPLTQTGCQFLEPEGTDHGFKTTSDADCKAINKTNGDERLQK